MRILKSWLQEHVVETLPSDEQIVEALTLKSSEVEGVETVEVGGKKDTLFDVKTLPDRSHYMLSHRGVAYDLCAIEGLTLRDQEEKKVQQGHDIQVRVESPLCTRYVAVRVAHINNTPSPASLAHRLEAIGARSINTIVDATNIAMFDTGQPLHAFDADKVKGGITIRLAREGESIETLTGEHIDLKPHHLIIADDEGPLAIAGIKGGKRAEVTLNTKSIILEAAHFDPVSIRKTSFEIGIRNDSSKRFENEITPYLVEKGVSKFLCILDYVAPGHVVGTQTDVHQTLPSPWTVRVAHSQIESVLNYHIHEKDIITLLKRLQCTVTSKDGIYEVIPPFERLDLTIAEDIIDEVGRIQGLEKVKSVLPKVDTTHTFSQSFLISEKMKDICYERGMTEVQTRSFAKKGDIEVAYPMAKDKSFLRTSLVEGVTDATERAVLNAPLLGLDKVHIFEIGSVFTKEGESLELCASIQYVKKVKNRDQIIRDELTSLVSHIEKVLGVPVQHSIQGNVLTVPHVEGLGTHLSLSDVHMDTSSRAIYIPYSHEPYIVRDIALFVNESVDTHTVAAIIKDAASKAAGSLLVKGPDLFDTFTKEGRTSLAFRLIFQAMDRTLSDDEVNGYMDTVYTEVTHKGWEVR